jgi:hypothetical protein
MRTAEELIEVSKRCGTVAVELLALAQLCEGSMEEPSQSVPLRVTAQRMARHSGMFRRRAREVERTVKK